MKGSNPKSNCVIKNKSPYNFESNGSKVNSEHEVERLRQLQYGREKLTLPVNKTNEVNMDVISSKIKKPNPERRKAKLTGHEACLAKVIAERRKIEIVFNSDESVVGELLEFDKYSVRIRRKDGSYMWYFKGAMCGFKEVD